MSKVKDDNKPVFDETLVADGFLFSTPTYRYLYVGQWSWEKQQWLNQNPDKWRRIEDVQREAASLAAPVKSELNVVAASSGPKGQTSSPDVRKDGDAEDGVALTDTPADNLSPRHQPESVPVHVNENVPKTEPPRSAEAATRETNGSETDTTPLEETGRKQGRAGGHQRKKRKLSAKVLKARRKRMRTVLEYLRENPILSDAARKAGICRKTLEYWIKHSKAGDDGYDIECDGLMWRFHELVEFAIDEAHDKIEEVAWERAKGELYKGKDGYEVPHLYVRRPDGKMIRFLLERWRPEKWGKHPKIDIPQKGGVLLIGGTPTKPAKCPEASIKARKWKSMAAMVRKTKG